MPDVGRWHEAGRHGRPLARRSCTSTAASGQCSRTSDLRGGLNDPDRRPGAQCTAQTAFVHSLLLALCLGILIIVRQTQQYRNFLIYDTVRLLWGIESQALGDLFPVDQLPPLRVLQVVHGRPAGRLSRPRRWPAVDNLHRLGCLIRIRSPSKPNFKTS